MLNLRYQYTQVMEIILNGSEVETSSRNLSELIAERGIPTGGLAVAVDSRIIRRGDWEATPLEEGMTVTLIRATQGG